MDYLKDTIVAPSTPLVSSAIGVIRLTGPDSLKISNRIFSKTKAPVKSLVYGDFLVNNEKIDTGYRVFLKAPNTYTGEDTVEFYLHGSPIILEKITKGCIDAGARYAEAGEFTKRSYLNGKLDLLQAEAVCNLINSDSEAALNFANDQLSGKFSKIVEDLGEPLKNILAEIEANIDFPEEDIPEETKNNFIKKLNSTKDTIENILNSYDYGKTIIDGYKVLLCGEPNAGKSSLFNKLLSEDRVIVSNTPGTTRDFIEVSAKFKDFKFIFCDSAGLRDTSDLIESKGIELTYKKIPDSDLICYIHDSTTKLNLDILNKIKKLNNNILIINNKIDIGSLDKFENFDSINISCTTNSNIDSLKDVLTQKQINNKQKFSAIISNQRQKYSFEKAFENISLAINNLTENKDLEIISIDVRSSLSELKSLIGDITTENILGRIFSKFCIGK